MTKRASGAQRQASKDLLPLWLIVLGVLAALLTGVTSGIYLPKDIDQMWGYATAEKCPPSAPGPDCLLALPGLADEPFIIESSDPKSSDVAQVLIDIDQQALTSEIIPSSVAIDIRPGEAEDLGITDQDDVPVTVTLYGGEAMELTGPTGDTVSKNDPPTVRFSFIFGFFVTSTVCVVAGVLYLWRRIRRYGLASRLPQTGREPAVPMPRWVLPAGLCVAGGLIAALVVGWLSVLLISSVMLVPVLLGGTVVGSVVLGWYFRGTFRRLKPE